LRECRRTRVRFPAAPPRKCWSEPQALASFLFHQHLINIGGLSSPHGVASSRHAQGRQQLCAPPINSIQTPEHDGPQGERRGERVLPARITPIIRQWRDRDTKSPSARFTRSFQNALLPSGIHHFRGEVWTGRRNATTTAGGHAAQGLPTLSGGPPMSLSRSPRLLARVTLRRTADAWSCHESGVHQTVD
jgi:hypothetical protein